MKKLLLVSSILIMLVGIAMSIGGVWGIIFTYKTVAYENITTTEDSNIPNTPVRGPLTLKAQIDIIKTHMFKTTGGKTYAEMPRQIEKLDSAGKAILGDDGKPVMVTNGARDMWVTAMTLISALSLGILSYAFSGFVFVSGLILILLGVIFIALSKKY